MSAGQPSKACRPPWACHTAAFLRIRRKTAGQARSVKLEARLSLVSGGKLQVRLEHPRPAVPRIQQQPVFRRYPHTTHAWQGGCAITGGDAPEQAHHTGNAARRAGGRLRSETATLFMPSPIASLPPASPFGDGRAASGPLRLGGRWAAHRLREELGGAEVGGGEEVGVDAEGGGAGAVAEAGQVTEVDAVGEHLGGGGGLRRVTLMPRRLDSALSLAVTESGIRGSLPVGVGEKT